MSACKFALLLLLSGILFYTGGAQIRVNSNQKVLNQKTIVAAKDVRKIGTFINTGVDYTVWKNGKNIPTNNMGGTDSVFQTVVNGSWSVGYSGYNLVAKKGVVSISIRVQNRKKYMVTVNYSTLSYLKMEATIQYSSDKDKDFDVKYSSETQEFSPEKKWPGSFSFIIEPELTKMSTGGQSQLAVGYPAVALIQLSIPEIKIKETGKTENEYYLNYLGITVKEIQ